MRPSATAKMNLKDVEKREKEHPPEINKGELNENDDKLPRPLPIPKGGKTKLYRVPPSGQNDTASAHKKKKPSTSLEPDFPGVHDNNTLIPPDLGGAVGPNHVMLATNVAVLIQDKSGTTISSVSLTSFFSSLSGITFPFDPHVVFDPYAQRWIITAPAQPGTTSASLCIGVSANSDPTGTWSLYSFAVDATHLNWFDYPNIGFNKNWITVTGNLFAISNGAFDGEIVYMFDKNAVYGGTASPTVVVEPTSLGTNIVPAVMYDNSINDMPLVSNWNGNSGGNGSLRLFTITGTPSSPTFTATMLFPASSQTWSDNFSGDFAPQSGVTQKIETGNSRMQCVVYQNGSLWCTHAVLLPAASPTHSAVQWWQIDPTTGTVQQFGRVTDGTGTNFYSYPSIAVNAYNDVLIGYSSYSGSQFASCNYSYRSHTDALNTLQPTVQYQAGAAKYYKPDTHNRNRWGDYTSTCIDPDNRSFWTVQEFADNPISGVDQWNTEWNRFVPPGADLYVKDRWEDFGSEPDFSPLPMWQSQDIWLRKAQDASHTFAHITENAEYRTGTSNPNYVYVEVRNRGAAASAGTEQLTLYWAKASSGLSWPDPWNGGIYFDPGPNTMLMGNVIGTVAIPAMAAGDSNIFEFAWNPPDPDLYSAAFAGDSSHFCLLARVTSSGSAPYGMTIAETGNLYGNVQNNNNIAWKNIEVYDLLPGTGAPGYFVIGNLGNQIMNAKLRFTTIDADGNPALPNKGTLRVTATGKLKDILKQRSQNGDGVKDVGDGVFEITQDGGTLQNVALDPKAFGTLQAQFVPTNPGDKLTGYAVTLTQLEDVGGVEHVIGGETAVFGAVAGFGTSGGGGAVTGGGHMPWWYWLIILLILIILFMLFRPKKKATP
jgi:hypothetical protein